MESTPPHDTPLPVAILAGGLATRLYPITEKIPKSLVQIHNKPFLSYQLDLLKSQGIQHVVLCVGHLGEMIQRSFGNGQSHEIQLDYSYDGAHPLGTAGALRRALPLLGSSFFVMYGDSYLPIPLAKVQNAFNLSDMTALMTVYRNHNQWDRSNVQFQNGKVLCYNKKHPTSDMHFIDYGLSILSSKVLNGLPENQAMDLADIYQELVQNQKLAGLEVDQRFYEIGSHSGLEEFKLFTQPCR